MKQPETLWILSLLISAILIIALVMHSIGLENEVEELQEENMILTDEIWGLKQYLSNEVDAGWK